jgi:hypothetical protein
MNEKIFPVNKCIKILIKRVNKMKNLLLNYNPIIGIKYEERKL